MTNTITTLPVPGYLPELLYTIQYGATSPSGICAVPNLAQASEDILSCVNSPSISSNVQDPGQGQEAANTGQPLTKIGGSIHGQVPGTSIVVNLPG
jgi:hypothetical protein